MSGRFSVDPQSCRVCVDFTHFSVAFCFSVDVCCDCELLVLAISRFMISAFFPRFAQIQIWKLSVHVCYTTGHTSMTHRSHLTCLVRKRTNCQDTFSSCLDDFIDLIQILHFPPIRYAAWTSIQSSGKRNIQEVEIDAEEEDQGTVIEKTIVTETTLVDRMLNHPSRSFHDQNPVKVFPLFDWLPIHKIDLAAKNAVNQGPMNKI